MTGPKVSDKEQAEKIKALRRELEDKLEDQLPPEMLESQPKVEVEIISGVEEMDPARAKQVIEALLFAATKPLTIQEIRKVLKSVTPSKISEMVQELQAEYATNGRSFEIHEVANGYEVGTKREFAPWIMRVELQKKAKQVTQSALETLAILAYKQPITRPEIEELRGVDVSGVLNTLMERDLVKIVGRKEVPGRPFMYGTTDKFLEHFGLKSLSELPSIDEIKKLVDNAVNKEELLGRPQVIDVPQAEAGSVEAAPTEVPQSESETTEIPAQDEESSVSDAGEVASYDAPVIQDAPMTDLGQDQMPPAMGDPL